MHKFKKLLMVNVLVLALTLESSFMLFSPVLAKADDLVIEDNGSVVILIINENSVLAAESGKKPDAPKPVPTATKVVVPPKTESSVKIDPKPSSDNKVKITVQTPTSPTSGGTPAKGGTTGASPNPSGGHGPNVTTASQVAVDKVVLNGADQKPVITISGDKSKDLNIQNHDTNLSTSLPVQIDNSVVDGSVKHEVSVTTSSGPVKLSVLPDVAVKSAEQEIAKSSLPTTKKDVALTQPSPRSDPTYVVKEEKKGKLFGLVNVTIKSEVDLSAKSGQTTFQWQSPFSFLVF